MDAHRDRDETVPVSVVPLGDVLLRVGEELGHVARLIEILESAVAPRLLNIAGSDPDLARDLQAYDQIIQRVWGLAEFLAVLAPAAERQWQVDPAGAARVVTLADMATRLAFPGAAAGSTPVPGGECELL